MLIGIINKPLLLQLVDCLYYCISDTRSYKHQIIMRFNKGKFVPVRSVQEAKAQPFLTLALLEANGQLHVLAALPLGRINNFVRIREIKCKNLRHALSVESCKWSKLNGNNHVFTYRIYSENYPDKIILRDKGGESI